MKVHTFQFWQGWIRLKKREVSLSSFHHSMPILLLLLIWMRSLLPKVHHSTSSRLDEVCILSTPAAFAVEKYGSIFPAWKGNATCALRIIQLTL